MTGNGRNALQSESAGTVISHMNNMAVDMFTELFFAFDHLIMS